MGMQYLVLRSADGKDFQPLGHPVATTGYVDRRTAMACSIFMPSKYDRLPRQGCIDQRAVGQGIAATPINLIPLCSPLYGGANRCWDQGFLGEESRADIGGYRIYRHAANTDNYEQIGAVSAEYTLSRYETGKENVRYYYAVPAVRHIRPRRQTRADIANGTLRH